MDFIFKHFGKFWIAGVLLGLGIWGVIIWAIIYVVLHLDNWFG